LNQCFQAQACILLAKQEGQVGPCHPLLCSSQPDRALGLDCLHAKLPDDAILSCPCQSYAARAPVTPHMLALSLYCCCCTDLPLWSAGCRAHDQITCWILRQDCSYTWWLRMPCVKVSGVHAVCSNTRRPRMCLHGDLPFFDRSLVDELLVHV
jgi:hypothetical protein